MSLKGGYQIINLKNREFSTTANNMEYYKDIYFNLLNSHAKMIIVSGLNMDGVKYNDYETIFYEVEQPEDNAYFQCIARRIWNTKDYKCITKYINIYSDDRVMCTQEEFTYEILPDGKMSLTSTNALQNKVITKAINDINSFIDIEIPIRFSKNGAALDAYECRDSKLILDSMGNCRFEAFLYREDMSQGALYADSIVFDLRDYVSEYGLIEGIGWVTGVTTEDLPMNYLIKCSIESTDDIVRMYTKYRTLKEDMRLADSDYYISGAFKIGSGIKFN